MSRDRDKKDLTIPGTGALEMELNRVRYQERYMKVIRSTVYSLITVAAVAVLVATLWMPVLQIYGSSMTPTLEDGEIVVSVKSKSFKQGEIIAFYYNNKILIKRVIAVSGEWVNMEEDGTVFVNDEELDEPYISEKAYGDTNIDFPYQVPESKIFVMGDHRDVSADSRNTAVGNISQEQILGKIIFRIWPLKSFGRFE